jgi:hypothetical protein
MPKQNDDVGKLLVRLRKLKEIQREFPHDTPTEGIRAVCDELWFLLNQRVPVDPCKDQLHQRTARSTRRGHGGRLPLGSYWKL